jgi:hypothetical protein
MAYQNINQYVYKKLYLTHVLEISDISLSSDERDYNEEVVFSPFVIGTNNGDVLPINIDTNNSVTSPGYTLTYGDYNPNNVMLSAAHWNPKKLDLNCYSATPLCDIGLVGTDNGLVTQMTGETIYYTNGLTDYLNRFDRYTFDRRFKVFQTTGYTWQPNTLFSGNPESVRYEVVSKTGTTEGLYHELYGGFYQGFYKLFEYDYQVFPERVSRGWSMEMLLKPRLRDEFFPNTGTTLNQIYPNNKNIFFYMGTRAENKYWHYADGKNSGDTGYTRVTKSLIDLKTCACSATTTGVTVNQNDPNVPDCIFVYPQSATTVEHSQGVCGYYDETVVKPEHDPLYDSMSNALAIKFSGDPSNPKLCARVLIMTGTCETTGSCETTGVTWVTGYTVQEWCSPKGINDDCSGTTYVNEEHWVLIDVVFERNIWWDECDLFYKGGLGTIFSNPYTASTVQNTVSLIGPPITHDGIFAAKTQIYNLNTEWLLEKLYRAGTLKFYVNGKLFWKIDNFEEIIPRPLDAPKERQAGVPYNFSWGGGTQGLHDNLVFKQPPTSLIGNTYQQDPEAFSPSILSGTSLSALTTNIMIEQNFAGTFEGAVAQFRMYTKALSVPEIQHNFRILKNKFKLYDPFCPNCLIPGIPVVTPSPTPTPTQTVTPIVTPTPTPTPTIP